MDKASRLTDHHKKARLEWAKEMLHQSPSKWMHTIFSYEKRFCLDGPDGRAHYWTDKESNHAIFLRDREEVVALWCWMPFCQLEQLI